MKIATYRDDGWLSVLGEGVFTVVHDASEIVWSDGHVSARVTFVEVEFIFLDDVVEEDADVSVSIGSCLLVVHTQ